MKPKINLGPITALVTYEEFAIIIRKLMIVSLWHATFRKLQNLQLYTSSLLFCEYVWLYVKSNILRFIYFFVIYIKTLLLLQLIKFRFISFITKTQFVDGKDRGLICGNIQIFALNEWGKWR
jgi:hypothetical protein